MHGSRRVTFAALIVTATTHAAAAQPTPTPTPAPTPPPAPTPAPTEPTGDAAPVTPPATAPGGDAPEHETFGPGEELVVPPKAEEDARLKPPLEYVPHEGIVIRAGKARMRFFLGVESIFQYGHCSAAAGVCEASDQVTTHVRRARFETEVKLPHHVSIDFGLQVKNEIIVLKKASLAWRQRLLTVKAGFIKPPGGIERNSSTWAKPIPERSVVANFKQDRILGVMVSRWTANRTVRLQAAAGRPPAGNFDAFEPEDVVNPPAGIEAEDLTLDPGNWDVFASLAYVPGPDFEVGLNATAHIAPDAGKGPSFAEPYETQVLRARYFEGAFLGGGFDISWHDAHVRASAEAVAYRSGETIPQRDPITDMALEPTEAPQGVAGYAVLGYTPDGEYGPAIDNSPLRRGYQLLLVGQGMTISPGLTADTTATFGSLTGAIEWQVHPQLRLQTDVAVQKFNDAVAVGNTSATRIYAEAWAQVVL